MCCWLESGLGLVVTRDSFEFSRSNGGCHECPQHNISGFNIVPTVRSACRSRKYWILLFRSMYFVVDTLSGNVLRRGSMITIFLLSFVSSNGQRSRFRHHDRVWQEGKVPHPGPSWRVWVDGYMCVCGWVSVWGADSYPRCHLTRSGTDDI